MKRKGGDSDVDGDRGPQCKRVQQSHSCEGLPPLDLTRTARASPVSYNELEPGSSHYSKQNHRPPSSSADPNGGEGVHSKKPTASSQSYNLLSEHPPRRPLCDAERGRVVGKMHEGFGARRKVFLSGLPTNYTDKSLANFLKEYSCATVSRVKDGSVRLLFTDPQKARLGLALLNATKFEGRKLTAAFGHPDSFLFVGNLPYTHTSEHLREMFQPHGEILRCFVVCSTLTGLSKGYGFVEFTRKDEALLAKQDMANKSIGVRNLRVDFADNGMQTCPDLQSRTLFVDRLPKGFKEDSKLRELFSKYGTVNFCQVAVTNAGLSRGFSFVDMSTSTEAEHAQAHCNGILFSGQEIRVSFGMPCRPGACILQHKTSGPPPYNPAGRASSAPPQENHLFTQRPLTSNPMLSKANNPAMYLPRISLYPQPPLTERTNGIHSLLIPSSFTFPLTSQATTIPTSFPLTSQTTTIPTSFPLTSQCTTIPTSFSLPSAQPKAAVTTVTFQGPPKNTPTEETLVKQTQRLQKKRPAPDPEPVEDLPRELVGVYDHAFIGQHQQGIPYTHPLKRIKMEDVV